jgi:hypothetical protein
MRSWRLPRGSKTPLLCSVVFDFIYDNEFTTADGKSFYLS